MGKSYRDMHRINELAHELINELKKFDDYIQGEVSYMSRDFIGQEIAAEMEKYGEIDPVAVEISDHVIHQINDEIDDWINRNHPEIEVIKNLLPLLESIKGEN